jgi:hypothetical protein
MIKLGDLLNENNDATLHKGKSKSGLDWGSDKKDNTKEDIAKLENTIETEELVEMYENDDGVDERHLKSYIKSIHKMAAELYNMLDGAEDPEEWVNEKAKQCNSLLNAIHGHIDYAKQEVAKVDTEPRDRVRERGW